MAQGQRRLRLPAVPGTAVRRIDLADGFSFRRKRGGRVDIVERRANKGVATLTCKCIGSGNGSCRLTVTGPLAVCSAAGCNDCVFEVDIPGERFLDYFGGVFAS